MADSEVITDNLLEMYGRDDWIMRWNFGIFLRRSGLACLDRKSRILDFGCAMGHLLRLLRQEGFTQISGMDAAPAMVEAARHISDCPVVLGNAVECGQLFPPGEADVIIISDLVHHIESVEEWRTMLAGCRRLLAPGGLLVIREPWQTPLLRLLQVMAHHRIFYIGPLKGRLRSFVEESALLDHFFANWPPIYHTLLREQGFLVEQDVSWLVHRITTARTGVPC
ncbi:MAG: class I SAM-dependent methyltransferase [Magnetococcales bacterium]|nr:class I SAM-dependent methyltransferase [Magnetococcales bacterium]